MAIQLHGVDDVRFFEFSEKMGAPLPLRRTLSLMRLLPCKTIGYESREWSDLCSSEICGQRYQSCKAYIDNLPNYGYAFQKKKCHWLYFFDKEIKTEEEIGSIEQNSIIGYCISQQDTFKNDDDEPISRSYLIESLINAELPLKGYSFGHYDVDLKIGNRDLKAKGNYFSQQNAITNCCAHAAIKMAIRGYYPHITCEKICGELDIDHIKRKGNSGLTPDEICTAIENLTDLKTYVLKGSDLDTPLDFLNAVYLALESRLPVILLFNIPDAETNQTSGHAVSLVGHTFNEHSWWAYGFSGYFSPNRSAIGYPAIDHLSSSLWCDNFVVQDDNLGPYYRLSSRFLTDSLGLSGILNALEKAMMTRNPISIRDTWLDEPVSAIFIYPGEFSFLKYSVLAENFAFYALSSFILTLEGADTVPKDSAFQLYFYKFFKSETSPLITRTSAVKKLEYLKSLQEIYKNNGYYDILSEKLPDLIWVTEISAPELFWINKRKVGEVILDPEKFEEDIISAPNGIEKGAILNPKALEEMSSVIFARLPNLLIFNFEGEIMTAPLSQDEPHHELIKAKGLTPSDPSKST